VHHNAAEDAVVCAAASIAAARALRVDHIRDLPEKIGMVAGRLTSTGYQPCSMKKRVVSRVA
jgi:DNA polymerase-3 subunit epsilon